ncbi:hypothetical protein BDP81DRAFT_104480 [Colletotrichum phormii]|uniref:Uncharacterized protein n=1 Tax=Colletotrichum phormii TaxID=359342 RepID=A0AAJ0ECT0_9PEZI|nr:uncharacterized protein BDP81DRAFT_104480 [Colletotrichum phormii]KAK1625008.1 hypothetical protein BDP81DRAFT_104480 [Colletotrichum phormii]
MGASEETEAFHFACRLINELQVEEAPDNLQAGRDRPSSAAAGSENQQTHTPINISTLKYRCKRRPGILDASLSRLESFGNSLSPLLGLAATFISDR